MKLVTPERRRATGAESSVLRALRELGNEASLAKIATQSNRSLSLTAELLNRLQESGHVARSLSDDRLETIWKHLSHEQWLARGARSR